MSTDWNVHCVDCNDTLGFNDANHQDELMALLCKHGDAIAALADLMRDGRFDVKLETYYGAIDADWFATHKGHKLVPISEYGDLLTDCAEYVTCSCEARYRCTLERGHAGEHEHKKRRA